MRRVGNHADLILYLLISILVKTEGLPSSPIVILFVLLLTHQVYSHCVYEGFFNSNNKKDKIVSVFVHVLGFAAINSRTVHD